MAVYPIPGRGETGRRACPRSTWPCGRAGSSPAAPTIGGPHANGHHLARELVRPVQGDAARPRACPRGRGHRGRHRLITSQNDTAPKLRDIGDGPVRGLITSPNDTAPKLSKKRILPCLRLITSQNDTAPKRGGDHAYLPGRLITSQNDTAPKLTQWYDWDRTRLITSQNDTAPKLRHLISDSGYTLIEVRPPS